MNPTTPDQGDERRAFEERYKHLNLSKTTDAWDRPVYCSAIVGALWEGWQEGRASLLAAAQPVAQEAIPPGYVLISIDALRVWGKLDEVQDACKYSLAAPQPSQGAQPVVDQEPASMSDNGSCGSQVSGKPVSAEAGKGECERCGMPPSWHVGAYWCKNQSFVAAPSESVAVSGQVSTGQILALERRSNMTDDEAIRYARSVLALVK